jgi:hypothetical protein
MAIQLTTSNVAAFNHAGHRGAEILFVYSTPAEYRAEAKILLVMEPAWRDD